MIYKTGMKATVQLHMINKEKNLKSTVKRTQRGTD